MAKECSGGSKVTGMFCVLAVVRVPRLYIQLLKCSSKCTLKMSINNGLCLVS